ncbi:hypothetical protein ACPUER_08870 [Burkholderia sp. DN3021]|uniref:hypothetical protein n=1 Tax=Burkholderia TaxID=32008 RepID=UPI00158BBE4C|nr:hypothetical protein [Burkholderia pyrrocinia]
MERIISLFVHDFSLSSSGTHPLLAGAGFSDSGLQRVRRQPIFNQQRSMTEMDVSASRGGDLASN